MKKNIFTGAATALITPFHNGKIDYESFGAIIEYQIANGIDALVVCGTTGESSALTDKEHREIIAYCVEKTAGRVPVIAGTGSNDTKYAVTLSKHACRSGADALLVVTPYYNKATDEGIVRHYFTIADHVDKPIIVYHIPTRTGLTVKPQTFARLSEHENIIAIKEASGNVSNIAMTMHLVGDRLSLYSGNDDQILPILSLGGLGVISVLSNLLPGPVHQICQWYLDGKKGQALALQLQLLPLIKALFDEVNPIPVKAAMHAAGFCDNSLRLPLTPFSPEKLPGLYDLLQQAGIPLSRT